MNSIYKLIAAALIALPVTLFGDSMEQITDRGTVLPMPDVTIESVIAGGSGKVLSLAQPDGTNRPVPLENVQKIIFGDRVGSGRLFDLVVEGEFGGAAFRGARVYYYESGWFLASPAGDDEKYWIGAERVISMIAAPEAAQQRSSNPASPGGFGGGFGQPDPAFGEQSQPPSDPGFGDPGLFPSNDPALSAPDPAQPSGFGAETGTTNQPPPQATPAPRPQPAAQPEIAVPKSDEELLRALENDPAFVGGEVEVGVWERTSVYTKSYVAGTIVLIILLVIALTWKTKQPKRGQDEAGIGEDLKEEVDQQKEAEKEERAKREEERQARRERRRKEREEREQKFRDSQASRDE